MIGNSVVFCNFVNQNNNVDVDLQITELTSYTLQDIHDLDILMHELSATSFCDESRLRAVADDCNAHLYIIRDSNHIIASACLCVVHTPEHTLGFVEAIVIRSDYRGLHLGLQLMNHLMSEARRLGINVLQLTSNPKRVAANSMYQSLDFSLYDTNFYKLTIQ